MVTSTDSETNIIMKILCWNVNGIRSVAKKGFTETVLRLDPDIICLQETRINSDEDIVPLPGYIPCFTHSNLKGRNGVAFYYKDSISVSCASFQVPESFAEEGRVQMLSLGNVFLINAYYPSSKGTQEGLKRRVKWNLEFNEYVKSLRPRYPVILCGDLNVAMDRPDLSIPKNNTHIPGCSREERYLFEMLIRDGMVDIWRALNPATIQPTWWSNIGNVRSRNFGFRLDYFLVDERLVMRVRSIAILSEIQGSDHCPLMLQISDDCFK